MKRIEKTFKESEIEKFKRLQHEYDLIRDNEHSEWYILNLRSLENIETLFTEYRDDSNPQVWFKYALFCLKYGLNERADILMNKYVSHVGLNTKMNILMGAMNL